MKRVDIKDSEKLNGEGLELSPFKIRLAQSAKDRDEAYKLRYQIFNEELGEGIPENALTKRDTDRFDAHCDHLLVERNGQVVGTYRLMPSSQVNKDLGFYSETEYFIKNLPLDFNKSLEMGRACILPEYRKQATLVCLFCGIRHYMNLKGCHSLFGLASLPIMSHENALATFEEIKKMGRVLEVNGVDPIPSMRIPSGTKIGDNPQIPALLSVYFQFGAYICGEPAYDPVFKCHDVLTILKLDEVGDKTWDFFDKFIRRRESAS